MYTNVSTCKNDKIKEGEKQLQQTLGEGNIRFSELP
jgi:hypothetical protein